MEKIRERHNELLARPFKHKVSKKYVVPDTTYKCHFANLPRPIVPPNNKRLNMLAENVSFKITPKYEVYPEPSTCVSRSVLEAMITPRVDHLSKPQLRVLQAMKKEKQYLGKAFVQNITEKIGMTLDTIYYHNVKSLMNIEALKKKSSKAVPKKPKTWDEFGDPERTSNLATPKPIHKPPPRPPRKWKDLAELLPNLEKLSVPLRLYKRPSQESYLKRFKVSPAALHYELTERVKKLTEIPAWRLVKPYELVAVKRSALFYQLTDRTKALAEPHPRAHAVESDLKEHPYDISPAALKYKPTPRIIELAKPIER